MHDYVCWYEAVKLGGSPFRSINAVPGGGPHGGTGYVDILVGRKMYEVKPGSPNPLLEKNATNNAKKQLSRYKAANPELSPGTAQYTDILPYGNGVIHVNSYGDGVMTYWYESNPAMYKQVLNESLELVYQAEWGMSDEEKARWAEAFKIGTIVYFGVKLILAVPTGGASLAVP